MLRSEPAKWCDLTAMFDAVVMLTWSDWHREPRSNRYHFATRFARQLPVIFVQPTAGGDSITAERVAGHAIEILHVPPIYDEAHARALEEELIKRKIRRPLIWIYNVFFADFVARSFAPMRIYHGTEDYVSPVQSLRITPDNISQHVRLILQKVDLMVAVSHGVADSYVRHGNYNGDLLVLPNGCDFDFWHARGACEYQSPGNGQAVAFYQGGVNARLDLKLLAELADWLPDWDFWFCGVLAPDLPGWSKLVARPNVRYHGMLDPEGVAALARQARVGLIPFKQHGLMRRSLPLKAYEYVACGLPVVTIPIDALTAHPDLFHTATDAAAFAQAIRYLAPSRDDPAALQRRLAAARAQSYDLRFERLLEVVAEKLARPQEGRPRLNVLMLYDDHSTVVHTIKEHLDAFAHYSRHRYHFLPATGLVAGIDDAQTKPDFGIYDALVIHYSVRVSVDDHLSPGVAELVTAYAGPKLLFIQDEYERTGTARGWIERLGIDAIFSNVPLHQIENVYPRARFPRIDFLPTLTGYVPEDPILNRYVTPQAERTIMIGYRGRRLPHHYGQLGQEKYLIGAEMKRLAKEAGLRVDIEVDDSKRIYGTEWYRFMSSCRATLGTESGANVFDDDGSLAKLAAVHANTPFEQFAAAHLVGREGVALMNQISPKVFEAIRLRTALILFEGAYSGVVQPERHFIPLKKDFSNIDEVFVKLRDTAFIETLTERAYNEIVGSGRYSYATFIDGVDRYLEGRCPRGPRATILSAPMLVRYNQSSKFVTFAPTSPLLFDLALRGVSEPRFELIAAAAPAVTGVAPAAEAAVATTEAQRQSLAYSVARRVWRLWPASLRYRLAGLLRPFWRLAPRRLRRLLVSRFL